MALSVGSFDSRRVVMTIVTAAAHRWWRDACPETPIFGHVKHGVATVASAFRRAVTCVLASPGARLMGFVRRGLGLSGAAPEQGTRSPAPLQNLGVNRSPGGVWGVLRARVSI